MKKKGFTLIEMLIVIVIIGILAAALIPRISSARGKAQDAARQAHLKGVSTAVINYQVDMAEYPSSNNSCIPFSEAFSGDILAPYSYSTNALPKDPAKHKVAFGGVTSVEGQYLYCRTKDGFIMVAEMEGEKAGNYTGNTLQATQLNIKKQSEIAAVLQDNSSNILIYYQ